MHSCVCACWYACPGSIHPCMYTYVCVCMHVHPWIHLSHGAKHMMHAFSQSLHFAQGHPSHRMRSIDRWIRSAHTISSLC
jgi:hypothetical protein